MNFKLLSIVLFLPSFFFVNAENFTYQNGNQTIHITVNPRITVEPSSNNIVVEPQNLTKIEKILEVIENKPPWTEGDLVIASSTIFAFFTFGSILVQRFQGKSKNEQGDATKIIILCGGAIQIIHLVSIASIILGVFTIFSYFIAILVTIIFIILILINVVRHLELANNEEEKDEIKAEDITPLKTLLRSEITSRQKAEDERDGYKRELNKTKHEAGN